MVVPNVFCTCVVLLEKKCTLAKRRKSYHRKKKDLLLNDFAICWNESFDAKQICSKISRLISIATVSYRSILTDLWQKVFLAQKRRSKMYFGSFFVPQTIMRLLWIWYLSTKTLKNLIFLLSFQSSEASCPEFIFDRISFAHTKSIHVWDVLVG